MSEERPATAGRNSGRRLISRFANDLLDWAARNMCALLSPSRMSTINLEIGTGDKTARIRQQKQNWPAVLIRIR